MERWAREEILMHNALMDAALQLVLQAEGHCENSTSNRIVKILENYGVDPDTGDMMPTTQSDNEL